MNKHPRTASHEEQINVERGGLLLEQQGQSLCLGYTSGATHVTKSRMQAGLPAL